MRNSYFTGLTLIAVGVLTLLQVLEIYNFGLTFWPTVLTWIGLQIVWGSLFGGHRSFSVVGVAIGLFVTGLGLIKILANAGLPVAMTAGDLLRLGWPVLLVLIGLSLLFGRRSWHIRF